MWFPSGDGSNLLYASGSAVATLHTTDPLHEPRQRNEVEKENMTVNRRNVLNSVGGAAVLDTKSLHKCQTCWMQICHSQVTIRSPTVLEQIPSGLVKPVKDLRTRFCREASNKEYTDTSLQAY